MCRNVGGGGGGHWRGGGHEGGGGYRPAPPESLVIIHSDLTHLQTWTACRRRRMCQCSRGKNVTDVKHIDNVSFHDRDEMCRWLQQLSNEGRPAVFVLFELEYLIPPSVKRAFTQKN